MKTYNGWTNYATWRINLEIFDGATLQELGWEDHEDAFKLGQIVEDYAKEIIEMDADPNGLAYSYAMAFLCDVNWTEIASSLIETYKDEVTQ